MNLLALAIILLSSLLAVRAGGYENSLCPGLGNEKPLAFNCTRDCIENHGAVTGKCGDANKGDYNCYCEGMSPHGGGTNSLHCREPSDDYRSICTFDCICSHAAIGGNCDWKRKACFCMDQGKNVDNAYPACPAKTAMEFAVTIYNYLGPSGLTPKQLSAIAQSVTHKG